MNTFEEGCEKRDGLGSELWSLYGVTMSELLNCEMVLKTVFVESSEPMRVVLVLNDDKGEQVRSEREIREDW